VESDQRSVCSFALDVSLGADHVVVAVQGELDHSSVGDLVRCVEGALVMGEPVELDLSEVSFFGAAGVGALIRLGCCHGRQVRRGSCSSVVQHTLQLCDLPELLA
jgi:anti-anti-sigma factor